MLWLIGGTSDSAAIAQALHRAQLPFRVTVTTEAGRSLYTGGCPVDRIHAQALDAAAMAAFVQCHSIRAILDASHPFATQVSQGAMATAQQQGVPYLRFERPQSDEPRSSLQESGSITYTSLDNLLRGDRLCHQRVLLILGYRLLPQFQPWQAHATLFTRILPSPIALETALASGFDPRRIIALRPPITPGLERALWQQWQVSMVVAKASGKAGGEDVKRAIAQDLGIELVLLQRPILTYPQQTSCVAEAITFARDHSRPQSPA